MFKVIRQIIQAEEAALRTPWDEQRRPARGSDTALTGTTRRWLTSLPARRRPLQLCVEFPRVANRLAWHWREPAAAAAVLEDLLQDRRGRRRGFPTPVVRELQRLRDFNDRARTEAAPRGPLASLGRLLGAD